MTETIKTRIYSLRDALRPHLADHQIIALREAALKGEAEHLAMLEKLAREYRVKPAPVHEGQDRRPKK